MCISFFHSFSLSLLLIQTLSVEVDVSNRDEMLKIVKSAIGTKFIRNWSDLACDIAMRAVQTVLIDKGDRKEIDIKRYAKVEKVWT